MSAGSVMSAITRSRPPQNGQIVMSISNTRFKRCAQVSGAVGGAVEWLSQREDLEIADAGSPESWPSPWVFVFAEGHQVLARLPGAWVNPVRRRRGSG